MAEFGSNSSVKAAGHVRLSPELLVERRNIFQNLLLQMVRDQHRDFLATLSPPITVEDDKYVAQIMKNSNVIFSFQRKSPG